MKRIAKADQAPPGFRNSAGAFQALRGKNALYSLITVLAVFFCLSGVSADALQLPGGTQKVDLQQYGNLYQADDAPFPGAGQDLTQWLQQRRQIEKISLFGGTYWLYAKIRHDDITDEWVLAPSNTLIDQVEARIYAPDGKVQTVRTGYQNDHEYMLHYGKRIRLAPNIDYAVLIKFSSPYFASYFRLGGDEFAIVARKMQEQRLHNAFAEIEQTLARLGYPRTGLSYGIAYSHECASPSDLFNISDQRMYQNKLGKKRTV